MCNIPPTMVATITIIFILTFIIMKTSFYLLMYLPQN